MENNIKKESIRFFTRLLHNILVTTKAILNVWKNTNYKVLNQYILSINESKDIDGILHETSKCLKNILNCNMFAFAIQDNDNIDAWITPNIYGNHFKKVIKNDFEPQTSFNTHYFHENHAGFSTPLIFNSEDLLSYVLMDEKYIAKLYLLPDRKLSPYQNDTMNIIIKTSRIALTNFINIKNLENAAAVDPLTNCYNRREFNIQIERDIARSHRYGKNLSIIMFDIDHFKKVNDTYGHQAGDKVLMSISRTILSNIRRGDYVSRYGGDEFIIALPETKKIRAMEIAERLRNIIERLDIRVDKETNIKVTASLGVASVKKNSNRESLVKEADEMLYKAKSCGRNIVQPYPTPLSLIAS